MSEIWAKTAVSGGYLPLEQHLDDAAAVAARLWTMMLTDRQRAWVAAGLGLAVRDAGKVVEFLAAVHDIGKATPAFQRLVPELASRLLDESRLRELDRGERLRHDVIGGALLVDWLSQRGMARYPASALGAAIAGHHGQLRSSGAMRRALRASVLAAPAWRDLQTALLDRLGDDLLDSAMPSPSVAQSPVMLALAGMVSVADWVASDVSRFPVPRSLADPGSATLADDALHEPAWRPLPNPVSTDFASLFATEAGERRAPRATQQAVIAAMERVSGPTLLLIEDRTGSGKTESALWAVRRGVQTGARGFYIGMPTKATANQLHGRTRQFADRAWPGMTSSLGLMHSGTTPADLTPQELDRNAPTEQGGTWLDLAEDATMRDAAAQAWFSGRRRGLLAPAAVGTVDQALLAVLNAKHFAVRLWALQGKVIVFDEVHAFDAYTGLVIERAVHWFAALDCSVVLLSATLPAARRADLVRAFQQGLCGESLPRPELDQISAGYPRITMVDSAGLSVRAVVDDRPSRAVHLQALSASEVDPVLTVAEAAVAAALGGGCVAVVCNTVASAQDRFRAIRARLPESVEVLLLHARMRPIERDPVERRLMDTLGPHRDLDRGRPRQLVVVATQIIEQSLDLDFDVMFSDLAPVDLLIQRAGRVHRHTRAGRPVAHTVPTLVVVDTAGSSPFRDALENSAYVYPLAVLARTRLVLRGRGRLVEPDDLDELVESVYGDRAPMACRDDEVAELAALDAKAEHLRLKLEQEALLVAVERFDCTEPVWEASARALRDPDELGATALNSAATRWSDQPSLSCVVVRAGELDSLWDGPLTRKLTEALLARSVSIAGRGVVAPVTSQWAADREAGRRPKRFQPPSWAGSPQLRQHLLIEVDQDGRAGEGALGRSDISLELRHDLVEGILMGKAAHDV